MQDRDAAVSELFHAHHRRLVGLAFLLVDDVATAEDVVQEAFATLYRRWRLMRDPHAALAYLNSSVVNGSRSLLRRRRTVRTKLPRLTAGFEVAASAEQDAVRHDESDRLWHAVAALPERQRQVLVLRYYLQPVRGRDRKHAGRLSRFGQAAREPRTGCARESVGGRGMTRSDLEGRLADLMLERAEGAMTATQTPEKLAELLGGRSPRPRRWVAGTVAVAAAAAVVVSAWLVRGDQPTTPTPASPTQEVAESVAADYLEALYRYDVETAEAQLADGAVIDGSADLDAWRSNMRWQRAAGMWLAGHTCEAGDTSAAGTPVRCTYALHGLGSERLGRGPFADNTLDVMVVDARITAATEEWPYTQNGFAARPGSRSRAGST